MKKTKPANLKDALVEIEKLEIKLATYETSPYFDTYKTVEMQLKSFNKQLTIHDDGKGKIDLFAEKDDKSFDRMKWYFDKVLALNQNLAELRKMMTPEQQKEIAKEAELQGLDTATRMAIKARDAKK